MSHIKTKYSLVTKKTLKDILADRFAQDKYKDFKNSPKVSSFKDIQKSTQRIVSAIKNKEKILLVADYDVDGVISRVLFEEFFDFIKYPLECITPDRFADGYGLSRSLIQGSDADLIITADNGITSYDGAKYCKENNIDLIITDHHIASTLPDAFAIIDPHQKDCNFDFKNICGAQVLWYLIVSLNKALDSKFDCFSMLDILIFAIVSDMMPLVSLNRVFVKKGLEKFSLSKRPAVLALKNILGKNSITSEDIGFIIGPKINASGRMDNAKFAIDFLRASDEDDAIQKWQILDELNTERKELQLAISNKAIELSKKISQDVVVVCDREFHLGIIGISASDVARKCQKCALIGCIGEDSIVKFSGRSFGGIDLYALLDRVKEYFISFGGHREAVGFSIELNKMEDFKEDLQKAFRECKFEYDLSRDVFAKIDIDEIDFELVDILDSFEPYGKDNERVNFLIKNAHIIKCEKIGRDKRTLKLSIKSSYDEISAIKFKSDDDEISLLNSYVDIIATVGVNHFRGNLTLQLLIDEILL